jgi:hypothetical protein
MVRSNGNIPNGTTNDKSQSIDRYTVSEAAQALDISPEAVRNRLSRGTLNSVKENGSVFVLLAADMLRHTTDRSSDRPDDISRHTDDTPGSPSSLISAKDETIGVLKAQLEAERAASAELRRIVAGLVQRVPQLEAASDTREASVTASDNPGREPAAPEEQQEPAQPRSWWHRFFFGS